MRILKCKEQRATNLLDGTNTVNTVVVLFPMCSDWASLERNYMSIKNMLTKKYGEPSDCIEEFQSLYGPYDDNERFYELGMGRCTYVTGFQTEKGSISV